MSFKIEHFNVGGKHITLESDGSIVLYTTEWSRIHIEYPQSQILKAMIIAEQELIKVDK